ncbi:helix-turn-helix domain-containing protein [Saccharothrix syringae]|uniref:XRE family transcriptional regulator n=1 Tax=Saccharothrix syringae TaxID=103733 RepID=A0A5Q0H3U8_SACSY|nr:helix-turn-helix transcriptional regulator [Saccharothrix syringae]QFZ20480.1 XRE family transcriptional regulator [Saccharothrix syringae]
MCRICRAAGRGDYAQVLRLARELRHLTQGRFASLIGTDRTVVSRYETGARPLHDITVLRTCARVLDLSGDLFGVGAVNTHDHHESNSVCPHRATGDDVDRRAVLKTLAVLTGASVLPVPAVSAAEPPDGLPTLRADLAAAHALFDAGRYTTLAAALPPLISRTDHLRQTSTPGQARDQATGALAHGYLLAGYLANKLGDYPLSLLLADRARTHAADTGDLVLAAAATREIAVALRHTDHHRADAARLLTDTADALPTTRQDHLAARGSLLVTAALGAARHDTPRTAHALFAEATTLSRHLPADTPAGTTFTASQMPLYRMALGNALGDSAAALHAARSLTLGLLGTPERRARAYEDYAQAWHLHGNPARCLTALQTAGRHCPDGLRRPKITTLVERMLDQPHSPPGLPAFAARIGIDLS